MSAWRRKHFSKLELAALCCASPHPSFFPVLSRGQQALPQELHAGGRRKRVRELLGLGRSRRQRAQASVQIAWAVLGTGLHPRGQSKPEAYGILLHLSCKTSKRSKWVPLLSCLLRFRSTPPSTELGDARRLRAKDGRSQIRPSFCLELEFGHVLILRRRP